MIKDVLNSTEELMKSVIEALKREFAGIRTGRANPALLDRVMVEYYGTPTPINQLASISVPEGRLLVVQPWDKSILSAIEKAILKADLGLNTTSDGSVLRIAIPQLTEERRKELVKVARKTAEEKRVAVRNMRRDANEKLKKFEKEGHISEDEIKKATDDTQKLTDRYIAEIDKLLEQKEKEIMEV